METKENATVDSTKAKGKMLTGMFADPASTTKAYTALNERGYTKDDINVVMSDETRKKHFSHDVKEIEIGTKAAEGAGKGSAIGGTIGAIAGAIAAIGTSFIIPGLGVLIAGPIAAGLAGAGAGGITGGLIGAMIGAGIPEERAKLYERGVKNGHVVLGVHPRNQADADHIEKSWKNYRAEEIYK